MLCSLRFIRKTFYVMLSFVCLMAWSHFAFALEVKDIRFGHYSDKTRLVLEFDQPTEFRSFALQNPARIVVDLPAFAWDKKVTADEKSGITDIRQGNLKPGISRIVLDSRNSVKIINAFTLPASSDGLPRLVIDFTKDGVNVNGSDSYRTAVFGNLNINQTAVLTEAPPPTPLHLHPAKAVASTDIIATDIVSASIANVPLPPRKNIDALPPLTQEQSSESVVYKPTIIIDPGHGGVDPGAIASNGLKEKNIVLALGQELRKQLEASGRYQVKMTRHNDTFIELRERVNYARKHQGDLFISIHADSIRDSGVSGASFYTLSTKASDAQAAQLAARENKADLIAGIELEVEDEAVVDILIDLARRNTQNQSRFFANLVADDFKASGIKTLQNSKRHANFAVLKAPDIPSILIETGFMSNAGEANKLNTDNHRQRIAAAVKKGVDAYFDTLSDNVLSANEN